MVTSIFAGLSKKMSLEFHKLAQQVNQMGDYLSSQEQETIDKIKIALEIMEEYADRLDDVKKRVMEAIVRDAGYRGASPLDEPVMSTYPAAPLPSSATLVATDGSQIPPNSHKSIMYYLINTGTIIVHHGSGEPPEVSSQPALFYESEYLRIEQGAMISAATVAARRTVAEMARLAEHATRKRGEARPLIALLDNPLLLIGMGNDVPDRDQLRAQYFDAMTALLDVRAGLAGYTDRPFSRYVVGMLHLLSLTPEEVTRSRLSTDGQLEGLLDRTVFQTFIPPGQRSAIFVLMSPLNKEFKDEGGETHEIAFFYLNVAAEGQRARIARVEIPMWVAEDKKLVAEMQALIYHQCQQVASRYPYILTRSHELAVVKHEEAQQLDIMIHVMMTRYGLDTSGSDKQAGKDAVSTKKTRFKA